MGDPRAPASTVPGPAGWDVNWPHVAFLTLSPLAAILGVGLHVHYWGFVLADGISLTAMLWLSGLAITAGYHRYYAHRSYRCRRVVQAFYLLFGAAALQNSVLIWASNHRYHHRFVDREEDPHNITRGWFWAYLGWALFRERPARSLDNVPDLTADRMVMWQHRHYLPLALVVGFGLPLAAGFWSGRPIGGLLWGGLVRAVLLHHITFFFNLAGHAFGRPVYSRDDSSRDSWWLGFVGFGEGYHNFHHTFPGDYRSGVCWYHWDPTKWWILGLRATRLASRLGRTSRATIQKARAEGTRCSGTRIGPERGATCRAQR